MQCRGRRIWVGRAGGLFKEIGNGMGERQRFLSHCLIHASGSIILLQFLANIPSLSREVVKMWNSALRPRMKVFVQFEGILRSPARNSTTSIPIQTPKYQQQSRAHERIVPPAPYPPTGTYNESVAAFARRCAFRLWFSSTSSCSH